MQNTQRIDLATGAGASVFKGLRVAVTGGTSGLGLALVHELQARGARVAFVARGRERVAKLEQEIQGSAGVVGDVSRKDEIHRIALQVLARLGGLDVLINNASDLGPAPLALLADTECEDLQRALDTNVLGPFRLTRALLGALAASARESRGAVVLNVSSDAALNPYPTWGAYGASKAALDLVSNTARKELATENIRVITIYPPNTATNAAKHMLGDPEFLRRSLQKALTSTGMVVVPAESVAEKIVEAARNEPDDLFLDEGLLKETVS